MRMFIKSFQTNIHIQRNNPGTRFLYKILVVSRRVSGCLIQRECIHDVAKYPRLCGLCLGQPNIAQLFPTSLVSSGNNFLYISLFLPVASRLTNLCIFYIVLVLTRALSHISLYCLLFIKLLIIRRLMIVDFYTINQCL